MDFFLCRNDFESNAFLTMFQSYAFPEEALMMVFTPAKPVFKKYALDETLLSQSEQGRIFSSQSELSWRRMDGRVRAVFLGGATPPEHFIDCSDELEGLEPRNGSLMLWGERTNEKAEWIEQQVPHRFEYPTSGPPQYRGRVCIEVENWFDPSGFIRFSRYRHIKEIPGEA